MYVSLLKNTNSVAKDPLNLNNIINTCLIGQKIILYYS